jgi:hypothetical protein
LPFKCNLQRYTSEPLGENIDDEEYDAFDSAASEPEPPASAEPPKAPPAYVNRPSLYHQSNDYGLIFVVGLCRLNQVDPYPITYSLSNP